MKATHSKSAAPNTIRFFFIILKKVDGWLRQSVINITKTAAAQWFTVPGNGENTERSLRLRNRSRIENAGR
jgi:hypothetical protein